MAQNCIECGKIVTGRQHAIQCESCELWQHRLCNTGVNLADYRAACKDPGHTDYKELCWKCKNCEKTPCVPGVSNGADCGEVSHKPTVRHRAKCVTYTFDDSDSDEFLDMFPIMPNTVPGVGRTIKKGYCQKTTQVPHRAKAVRYTFPDDSDYDDLFPIKPITVPGIRCTKKKGDCGEVRKKTTQVPHRAKALRYTFPDDSDSDDWFPIKPITEPGIRHTIKTVKYNFDNDDDSHDFVDDASIPTRKTNSIVHPINHHYSESSSDSDYDDNNNVQILPVPITYEVVKGGSKYGKNLLVDTNGYSYNTRQRVRDNLIYWKCYSYYGDCSATVIYRDGNYTQGYKYHCHPPPEKALEEAKKRVKVREMLKILDRRWNMLH